MRLVSINIIITVTVATLNVGTVVLNNGQIVDVINIFAVCIITFAATQFAYRARP